MARSGRGPGPPFLVDQEAYATLHLVPDPADAVHRLSLRILQRPVVAPETGHDGAGLAAAHRDEEAGLARHLPGQLPRRRVRQIDAALLHDFYHFGVDP